MFKKSVFGLVSTEEQAQTIVDRLLSSGFVNEDISILSPDRRQVNKPVSGTTFRETATGTQFKDSNIAGTTSTGPVDKTVDRNVKKGNLTTEKHTKAPEGGVTGGITGGILGGSLGLLAGIGALAIPGLGAFIAAGPIMAALSGTAVGGSLGLVVGALIGAGIPEYEAKKYESGLKAGNILISVHTESEDKLNQATEILKKEGAKDISSSKEKTRSH